MKERPKHRADDEAMARARALRQQGFVPLLETSGIPLVCYRLAGREGTFKEGAPTFYSGVMVAFLGDVHREDLLHREVTRLTSGRPKHAAWAPLWVAAMADLADTCPRNAKAWAAEIAEAERYPSVRERYLREYAELSEGLAAMLRLGGSSAVAAWQNAQDARV